MEYKLRNNKFIIERFNEGMEDRIEYHIPMFGNFTKEECIDAGFTPDFENEKIYVVELNGKLKYITTDYYIVTDSYWGYQFKLHESDLPLLFERIGDSNE